MTQNATSATPRFLPIKPENIPDLLKQQPRWLCWKAGPPKPDGKFDKFPVDPRAGYKINGRDERRWQNFAEVMNAYDSAMVDGIGFALSDKHPIVVNDVEFYVTVTDHDQCAPRINELHTLWLELGRPWTEVSPSKRGLHMWGLTRSPLKGGNAGDGRELYSSGRFMTITGIDATGSFGECSELAALEQQWFPPTAVLGDALPLPPVIGFADIPGNTGLGQAGDRWFDLLSPADKSACLAAMLQVPAVIALADTPDDAPSPNWRTVMAACARSGAPNAETLCRVWAATSPRFLPDDFEARWRSYARG